jgi:predicted permease
MRLRTTIRSLLRERTFVSAVVATLAIGIGGCLTMFTVIKAVLFAPLPYLDANRLVSVWMSNPPQGIDRDVISHPMFRDWRDESRGVFAAMSVHTSQFGNILAGSTAEEVRVATVSEEFFATVGVAARLGRTFTAEDFVDGRHRVLVLSHGLWQRAFGGRSDVLGRDLLYQGRPHTIVGVLSAGAEYPPDVELWAPLANSSEWQSSREARGALWLNVIARLHPHVTVPTAAERMRLVQAAQNAAFPDNVPGTGTLVTLVRDDLVGPSRRPLWLLQGAVVFVLLIACANVSNLFLARATAREREVATRVALGAGGRALARQWMGEAWLLASAGGGIGLLLAIVTTDLVVRAAPPQIPRLAIISVDWVVVSAAIVLAMVTAILIGVAPLARLLRTDLAGTLKDGARTVDETSGRGRLRLMLVAAQFALALILLVGAGLLLRSFAVLADTPSGFTAERVLSARVALPGAKYPQASDRLQFWERLRRDVAALPGVERVAGVSSVLLGRLPNSAPIVVEGRPDLPESLRAWPVALDSATPGYFDAVGMQLLRGRDVSDSDQPGRTRVVVVNDALASTYFGTLDVIGRRIAFDGQKPDWLEIVGVVSNARRTAPELEARPETYFPHAQRPTGGMTLIVRTAQDPIASVPAIRDVVRRLDPEQPVARVTALQSLLDTRLAERRFLLALLGGFATVALMLSIVGIYGVMSYTVGRRRQEFGIRAALGARRGDLSSLVLRQGLIITAIGVGAGVVGAVLVTRLLEGLLFGVQRLDRTVFASVTGVLAACALLACWLPARRAAKADPMRALRHD